MDDKLFEDYSFQDNVCSDERVSLLTKIDSFKNLFNSKLKVFCWIFFIQI